MAALSKLPLLPSGSHVFQRPGKRIADEQDVTRFLSTQAYRDIGLFILQLNHALCPRTTAGGTGAAVLPTAANTTIFTLQSPPRSDDAPSVQRLRQLLDRVGALIEKAPPATGPRRFGNVSFRKWHALLGEEAETLLEEYVPSLKRKDEEEERKNDEGKEKEEADNDDERKEAESSPLDEVMAYFLGAFGSAQRLDYGTGHELSFLAFLGCLWKLGVFADGDAGPDNEAVERTIVLGVFEPYLLVVRKLIRTYTLEPAGSHGVWGLDDHSFLPFVFGSAQLTRPLAAGPTSTPMPQMGSAPHVPRPADIIQPAVVAAQRPLNLYFSAIGFIYDVKTGAFWEHSSMLFDISGIRDGWGKVNKGMIKMYNAEVLSKFPVVQHFPFGSLFSWDLDPEATIPTSSSSSFPSSSTVYTPLASATGRPTAMHLNMASDPVPGIGTGTTAAPWAHAGRMPQATPHPAVHSAMPTRVPFLPAFPTRRDGDPREQAGQGHTGQGHTGQGQGQTK